MSDSRSEQLDKPVTYVFNHIRARSRGFQIEHRAFGRTLPKNHCRQILLETLMPAHFILQSSTRFNRASSRDCLTGNRLSQRRICSPRGCSPHRAEETRSIRLENRWSLLSADLTCDWFLASDSLRRLRELSGYAAARQGRPEMEYWKTLLARLGCALGKGNALNLKVTRSAMYTEHAEEREFDLGGALPDRFAEAY